MNSFRFRLGMMDDDCQGERSIAGVHFSGDEQNRGEYYIYIIKSVEYIKLHP